MIYLSIIYPSMTRLAMICLALFICAEIAAAGTKPEDVVAQNLDSIGTAEARSAVKSLGVQGTLRFKILVGGAGESTGKWQRFSEQHKSNFLMEFNGVSWRGERFIFDGDKTSFASATASYHRSAFAEFVKDNDFIFRDGLLGGALSTNWALLNYDRHHAKLESMGIKKVDGRDLQGLEYLSKNNGEMTVRLYFEPDTHRHVMTVYSVIRGATVAHNDIANAQQNQVRYVLEERFSDFQTDNGITLPRQYDLRFSQQLQNGTTNLYDWAMSADKVIANPTLDPANFQVK
jgi:hypothetical protein